MSTSTVPTDAPEGQGHTDSHNSDSSASPTAETYTLGGSPLKAPRPTPDGLRYILQIRVTQYNEVFAKKRANAEGPENPVEEAIMRNMLLHDINALKKRLRVATRPIWSYILGLLAASALLPPATSYHPDPSVNVLPNENIGGKNGAIISQSIEIASRIPFKASLLPLVTEKYLATISRISSLPRWGIVWLSWSILGLLIIRSELRQWATHKTAVCLENIERAAMSESPVPLSETEPLKSWIWEFVQWRPRKHRRADDFP
ncbi:hypothetical protein BDZ91DRAFT_733533 [Kalaharituber pfeilii]|nr:hypothetical protein BDZ91DRAFT_733533 [Kalaharituber pfeilii]